jgi:valyl-tRNA synthetase
VKFFIPAATSAARQVGIVMSEELSKVYEPKTIERQANEVWLAGGYFHAEPPAFAKATAGTDKKVYTIVIPPPNVTAPLHLGHALNNTLQDILIRFRRMQQYTTLWMPGTDHAGIATQTVVEKRILAEEGKRRTDFEREEFVGRVQAWKDEYEARIIEQLKAMGCSCDWQRTRFTMDEVCAKAVRAAFFKLFKDGLIYRGKRLVNWDPATQTVLADDEVEHETIQGYFWYLRYPLVEPISITAFQAVDKYSNEIKKRYGAYLPHWTRTADTYAVTFRLEDALPMEVFERLTRERDEKIKQTERKEAEISEETRKEITCLYREKVESYLDEGHGKCHLADGKIANLVHSALNHFDGERYNLIAWAVMPNHVHAILKPCEGFDLPDILHSWKSYTANKSNEVLGQTGKFWQVEYYDHLICDEEDFYNQVNYVLNNPAKAGLEEWEWVGVNEDAIHGQDARATNHGLEARVTHVTVATTRPETMLGDTAVAMNPNDPRAKYLVGKKVRLPIVGRIIPIIADEHVVLPNDNHGQDARATDEKAKYSTGFLKVTPAHDPDDWEIGQRHGLEIINVMAPDGTISDKYGWTDWEDIKNPDVENLIGMDRFEAREAIVEWFKEEGLFEGVKEYSHEVGHSYRSHVPIEPYLSDQWYIAVKKPIEWHGLPARENTAKMAVPQSFIKGTDVPVNSLAGIALKPLLDGRLRFTPDRYKNTYQSWLENLRDWPISRQLWWGHRIPVWTIVFSHARYTKMYDTDNKHDVECEACVLEFLRRCDVDADKEISSFRSPRLIEGTFPFYVCGKIEKVDEILELLSKILSHKGGQVTKEQLKKDVADNDKFKAKFGEDAFKYIGNLRERITTITLDVDVLDTWFSSALWPFSTLGWPDDTPELKTFYPGDVLCTAREIITLWVSRMVMMGQYCVGDIPFTDVYIHAMIQDGEGRKMSKSLGNGIDPLVAINSHGADAMRFTLANMTTDTQDIRMPVLQMTLPDGRVENTSPKFDVGRNFCNKLWNASRFVLMNLDGIEPEKFDKNKMDITDRWILSRLSKTICEVTKSLDEFNYNEPLTQLYRFFWNDFCDWYLEWAKPRMQDKEQKPTAQNVLAFVLDQTLRLLHPFVPFITEGIFQKLNDIAPVRKLKGLAEAKEAKALVTAQWPDALNPLTDEQIEQKMTKIQDIVRAVREIENKYNVKTVPTVSAISEVDYWRGVLNENRELICYMAGAKEFKAAKEAEKPENAATAIVDDMQIYVYGVRNIEAERQRLQKQKAGIEKAKMVAEGKLTNENFIAKAKPEVVAQAKERLAEVTEQLKTIEKYLEELK